MATAARMKKTNDEYAQVFETLRALLKVHATRFRVTRDDDEWFQMETKSRSWKGKPLMFAGVRNGKAYVAFHLVPVYMYPEMVKKVSPELKKRMQGKACFNFKKIEPELFEQLAVLAADGLKRFEANKLL